MGRVVASSMVLVALVGCGSSTEELCLEECDLTTCAERDCTIDCPQYRDGASPCDGEARDYYECSIEQLEQLEGTCDISKIDDLEACTAAFDALHACLGR